MFTQTAPSSGTHETRSHPVIIALCMVITVIEGYNLIVFGSVVPLLLKDDSLGVTAQQMGGIGGLVYIGAILGAVVAPLAAERFGRKSVLIAANLIFALGAVLTGAAMNGQALGLARFLTGLGVGGALTTAMTLARNNAASHRASLVVTITMAGVPMGGVIAALVAIPVLPAFGWRVMFFIGAALAGVIVLAVIRTEFPTGTPQDVASRGWSGGDKLRSVFHGRGALVAVLIAACAIANMVAWQGLNVWAVESMVQLGFALKVALLFTFCLTGAAVIGSFATAWAADKWGSAPTAVVTGACTLIGLIGILLLPVSVATAVPCVALMGIGGHSTMNLVHTTTSNIYPMPARAAAMGWSNSTSFIGAFLGPTLGGLSIAANGPSGIFTTFAIAATVCLASLVGLYLVNRFSTHESFRSPAPDYAEDLLVHTPAV